VLGLRCKQFGHRAGLTAHRVGLTALSELAWLRLERVFLIMPDALLVKAYTTEEGEQKWRVQRTVKGQHCNLGIYDSEKRAYQALQKKWPDEKHALSKKALTAAKIKKDERKNKLADGNICSVRGVAPKRLWEGITYEPDRKKWKVQTSGPRFDDQKEAAMCFAKREKVTLKSLEIQDGAQHRFQHHHLQEEFRRNYCLHPFITPGDLADSEDRVCDNRSQKAFEKQPGILPIFWVCKLTSTKDSLISVVLKTPLLKKSSGKFSPEVEHLYACLVENAQLLNGTRWPACWYESVNRTQFHWMNYWAHLFRMKVLQRLVSPSGSRKKMLKFDEGKSYFKVRPLSQKVALSLQHQIDWGRECLRQSPMRCLHRSVQDAANIVNALSKSCPRLEGACNSDGYVRQWLNRCCVFYCMRFQGIKRMKMAGFTVKAFLDLDFPDEKKVVLPLLTMPGLTQQKALHTKLEAAFQHLGYKGPPELFHMYACFFSNDDFVKVIRSKRPLWIKKNLRVLRRWSEHYYSDHGIWPHPRLIVQANQHLP
jgi:hypothetical protein